MKYATPSPEARGARPVKNPTMIQRPEFQLEVRP